MIDWEGNNNLQNTESKRGKAGVMPDKEPDSNRVRKSDSKGYYPNVSVRCLSDSMRTKRLLAHSECERSAIQQESELQ